MQLTHIVWVVNILTPTIQLLEAYPGDNPSIHACSSLAIEPCNRFSPGHCVWLPSECMIRLAGATLPHQASQSTLLAPVASVDGIHLDGQSATAHRHVLQPAHAQTVCAVHPT